MRFRFLLALLATAACGSSTDAPGLSSGGSAGAATGGGGGASGNSSGGSAGSAAAGRGAGSGGLAGAAGTSASGGTTGSGGATGDHDGDGIDDGVEQQLALDYYPFYSIQTTDNCKLHGVLFRLSPHPGDASKITIWYDVLYRKDCGLAGHDGDDEVFGVVIDQNVPAPQGILAVRAISHQNTACEHTSTCGSLPGCSACSTGQRNGKAYPAVYSSKDKHGSYAELASCNVANICEIGGGCALSPTADVPMLVNAGEPSAPLVTDLTTQGFITQANGWTTPALLNYNPWGNTDFGGAGNVTGDLADQAFVVDPSGC